MCTYTKYIYMYTHIVCVYIYIYMYRSYILQPMPFAMRAMRVTLAMMLFRAVESNPADWMERNFQQLQHKTLLQLTLPGSHNSGNYQGGLHADLPSDRKFVNVFFMILMQMDG